MCKVGGVDMCPVVLDIMARRPSGGRGGEHRRVGEGVVSAEGGMWRGELNERLHGGSGKISP